MQVRAGRKGQAVVGGLADDRVLERIAVGSWLLVHDEVMGAQPAQVAGHFGPGTQVGVGAGQDIDAEVATDNAGHLQRLAWRFCQCVDARQHKRSQARGQLDGRSCSVFGEVDPLRMQVVD